VPKWPWWQWLHRFWRCGLLPHVLTGTPPLSLAMGLRPPPRSSTLRGSNSHAVRTTESALDSWLSQQRPLWGPDR